MIIAFACYQLRYRVRMSPPETLPIRVKLHGTPSGPAVAPRAWAVGRPARGKRPLAAAAGTGAMDCQRRARPGEC
jgi:hypothetical protein